ncbi:MAG: methyltransferase domain-containing protein [Bacteroidota bacterium]
MTDIKDTKEQKAYWSERYTARRMGWDIGFPSTPIKTYIDQLEDKNLNVLIPGAGNAYEAEYLFQSGFSNVHILDISSAPLRAFQQRVPNFPKAQLLEDNFFEHQGQYDLIFEQTFFCSFPPTVSNRQLYAKKMHELLLEGGKLVGLWFDFPLEDNLEKRPFGGTKEEYLSYLSPLFQVHTFERSYNSIPPRADKELFGIFQKVEHP